VIQKPKVTLMYMAKRIESDRARFKKIVRGAVRSGIRKYLSRGELIGKRGKDFISIPLPELEIPRFRFGEPKQGVGQGEGNPGDPVAFDPDAQGQGEAGSEPGEHILEVEMTIEELAEIMAEELALPNIEPRGKKNISSEKDKYVGIAKTGPESLRHFKRTFRQALRRQIISGTYDPTDPKVWPVKEDKRYRSWKTTLEPESNAVIIYMMDVSGSMGDMQKELVRLTSFWIDTWLISQYKGVERRFIIHDALAKEVDQETFFHTRESGGTRISSAYEVCIHLIKENFPPEDYNIYPFHFTDGDNFSDDDERALKVLEELVPDANVFCYGQVAGSYGSGHFLKLLQEKVGGEQKEKVLCAEIKNQDGIYDALKAFLGTGR
jgi:sporulation protein YhbH